MGLLHNIGARQIIDRLRILLYLIDRLMIHIRQQDPDSLTNGCDRLHRLLIRTTLRITAMLIVHDRIKMLAEGLLVLEAITAKTVEQCLISFFPNCLAE